jgi:hypothetical protein
MDENVMMNEERRDAETASLERERQAFKRTHSAWIAVQNQFKPFGNGQPTQDSIDEYYAAERHWEVAQSELERFEVKMRSEA